MGVICTADPRCTKHWDMDPVLAVPCPDCQAGVGVKCKRPSGHAAYGGSFHRSRDLAADAAGAYGPCPFGICGLENKTRNIAQPTLFDLDSAAER